MARRASLSGLPRGRERSPSRGLSCDSGYPRRSSSTAPRPQKKFLGGFCVESDGGAELQLGGAGQDSELAVGDLKLQRTVGVVGAQNDLMSGRTTLPAPDPARPEQRRREDARAQGQSQKSPASRTSRGRRDSPVLGEDGSSVSRQAAGAPVRLRLASCSSSD